MRFLESLRLQPRRHCSAPTLRVGIELRNVGVNTSCGCLHVEALPQVVWQKMLSTGHTWSFCNVEFGSRLISRTPIRLPMPDSVINPTTVTPRAPRFDVPRTLCRCAAIVVSVTIVSFASPDVVLADAFAPAPRAPLEIRLLEDASDGRLDQFTFLDASLIASGVATPRRLKQCREHFQMQCERFRVQHPHFANHRELAIATLAFLHRNILTAEYQIETTRVDRALTTGHYNCVASTILFRCLSAEFGVVPVVVATPSHVFCRYAEAELINVETTCPDWFALPLNSDLVANHPANQARTSVRPLSDVQVLGKLFYNRATDKLDAREYAAACTLLRTALALDPADEAARENLLAAINNWSLQQCEAGDFTHAAQLLTEGTDISREYTPLQMNDLHVHQQWTLHLCQQQEFGEALALLESCYRRRPDARLFDQGRFAVYGLWAESLFSQGKDVEALRCFDQALQSHPDRPELRQRESAAILRAVQRRLEDRQWVPARELLERGLARQPDHPQLQSMVRDLTVAES